MKPIKIKSIDNIELDAVIHNAKRTPQLGCIIQTHGISTDMDEGGMFVRLADKLARMGFNVIRFSYRGHGKSGGTQRGVTISGEMLDLQAVLDFVDVFYNQPLAIVAASFGAVSTCLSLPYIEKRLIGLALWNPVLSLRHTFIDPELPWGKKNFNNKGRNQLAVYGFLLLDGSFEIGRVLYEEMKYYDPHSYFINSSIPSMIIHGDKDSYVSYPISLNASKKQNNCEFFSIKDSDHGFDSIDKENKAINITSNWLDKIFKNRLSS